MRHFLLIAFIACSTPLLAQTTQPASPPNMNVDVSPDGKTIVFDLHGDIYIVPLAGGNATRLTSGQAIDTEPVFSPDGRQIAFVSNRSGNENVWVIDASGQNIREFTKERTGTVRSPEWLTGGEFI